MLKYCVGHCIHSCLLIFMQKYAEKKYGNLITGVPKLIIVKRTSGKVIQENAVQWVYNDPKGSSFPWNINNDDDDDDDDDEVDDKGSHERDDFPFANDERESPAVDDILTKELEIEPRAPTVGYFRCTVGLLYTRIMLNIFINFL